jgi:hypothetical protein
MSWRYDKVGTPYRKHGFVFINWHNDGWFYMLDEPSGDDTPAVEIAPRLGRVTKLSGETTAHSTNVPLDKVPDEIMTAFMKWRLTSGETV